MKVQSKLKLIKVLFFTIVCSFGFDLPAFSSWSVPYQNMSQDCSQALAKSVASNVMWQSHAKNYFTLHVDTKHTADFPRSEQNNLWLEIKRCAHYLVNHDPDVSALYQRIRHDLYSILHTIQKGTTHEQLMVIDRLQELKGSFNQYEQALQTKFNQIERSLHTPEQLEVISCSMDITRYLKYELHNVLDSIKIELSKRDGTFLGKEESFLARVRETVVQCLKKCLGAWTPESIIRAYVNQYTNGGRLYDMPAPDPVRLKRIEQNRFNQDIKRLESCLKQADTVGVRHIVEAYAGNKRAHQLMKSFVDSSPYSKQHRCMLNEARQLVHDKSVLASDTLYYQSREQALQQVAQGDLLVEHKQYSLSSETAQALKQAGYDPVQFRSCTGNLVQQDTHAKLVNSLNQLAQKQARTQSARQIKDGVLDCAQAGNALNQVGSLKEAMLLSDLCHVAVDYLWHGIDTGIVISKGVAEGMYVGMSSEIAQAFHESQEAILTEGGWTDPGLQSQVAMETATVVADLVKLVKDSGEVAFSGIAGVGDAIVGLPELVSNCLEATQLTGKCVGRIGLESAMLIDAAEREDVTSFERHAHTMQHTCAQVSQGINDYLAQLKKCRHQYNGCITKEDLKGVARAGGRFVAEGVILSNVLKGSTKILKGAAYYAQSAESACARLQHIKDVSGAQVRNVLLNAQLNLAPPIQKMPAVRNAIEQVVTHASPSEVTRIPSVAQAAEESIAKAIVQPSEGSLRSLFAQKIGQLLSCEPKPGYILIPGIDRNKLSEDNEKVFDKGISSARITNKQALAMAQELGFKKTNYYSHGQPVFQKGNKFITLDIDSHNGGIWKMAGSVRDLSSKKTRLGTYDKNLNRIGG